MNARFLSLSVLAASLAGCASGGLSGIGGSSDYACLAPPGVSCMSVTGISVNAAKNNLPALKTRNSESGLSTDPEAGKKDGAAKAPASYGATVATAAGVVSPKGMDAPYSGMPLHTPPRLLRIWMAPYQDTDTDLHDQKYMYVMVHSGRWLLEANQVNIQLPFKQVFPLGKRDDGDDGSAGRGAAQGDTGEASPADKLGAARR
ncbi:type IV conjugative transfer system lipoprotein TraV [Ottowia sp.]|uniref:type IV conjugative transfer system lipoprotein TraV n=1 Tax=Ottowia sp. TaxID=1898956 RepID=UPI00260066F7|nr:type IV conjugative transfer system lipoprotein TraV [Ottowia sp.]MBK6616132.1 type IV conjugative transfer system lipoprotein TraV [Ottowia sp.]